MLFLNLRFMKKVNGKLPVSIRMKRGVFTPLFFCFSILVSNCYSQKWCDAVLLCKSDSIFHAQVEWEEYAILQERIYLRNNGVVACVSNDAIKSVDSKLYKILAIGDGKLFFELAEGERFSILKRFSLNNYEDSLYVYDSSDDVFIEQFVDNSIFAANQLIRSYKDCLSQVNPVLNLSFEYGLFTDVNISSSVDLNGFPFLDGIRIKSQSLKKYGLCVNFLFPRCQHFFKLGVRGNYSHSTFKGSNKNLILNQYNGTHLEGMYPQTQIETSVVLEEISIELTPIFLHTFSKNVLFAGGGISYGSILSTNSIENKINGNVRKTEGYNVDNGSSTQLSIIVGLERKIGYFNKVFLGYRFGYGFVRHKQHTPINFCNQSIQIGFIRQVLMY